MNFENTASIHCSLMTRTIIQQFAPMSICSIVRSAWSMPLTKPKWLWHTLVDVKRIYALDGWPSLYLIVLVIIAIFFVCVAIDIIRKKTIEKIIFQQIDKIL